MAVEDTVTERLRLLEDLLLQGVKRAPYNYSEYHVSTPGTTTPTEVEFSLQPDCIVIHQDDTTNDVYANFAGAASATNAISIKGDTYTPFYVRTPKLSLLAAGGTPNVFTVAFAYDAQYYRSG